jgi:hypothetical protein
MNFYTMKGSLSTDWMQENQQLFLAGTELLNYVKAGAAVVKMCGI